MIGRFVRVRELSSLGLSPSLVLDRKKRVFWPYREDEWVRLPSGVVVPPISGGAYSGFHQQARIGLWTSNEASVGGLFDFLDLDGPYSAGSSGPAIGTLYHFGSSSRTITDIYLYIGSYAGTPANVDDLNIEFRSGPAEAPDTTGAGLLRSQTFNPASQTGWIKVTLDTPLTISGGGYVWAIIGDADGNATDFARINRRNAIHISESFSTLGARAGQTANGWQGVTNLFNRGGIHLVFDDGKVMGWPFSSTDDFTFDTNQKGLRISDGFKASFRLFLVASRPFGANIAYSSNVWEGETGPTGTPYASSSLDIDDPGDGVFTAVLFDPPVLIQKNTPYRVVFKPPVPRQDIRKNIIGTGADANLRKMMPGGGFWFFTSESSGEWVDDVNAYPNLGILVEDFVEEAGESATGSLFNRGFN